MRKPQCNQGLCCRDPTKALAARPCRQATCRRRQVRRFSFKKEGHNGSLPLRTLSSSGH
jgi:hypothetical protein